MIIAEEQAAVRREVHLVISEAKREGDTVHPDAIAGYVAAAYPHSGFGKEEIARQIRVAAIEAGLPVEANQAPPTSTT